MPKHNNAVPNVHHHKDWQRYVRTWFNQPARKHRRQLKRQAKVAAAGIRPVDKLRPVVRCPTTRYNWKVRAGRGFTLEELKAVKLIPRAARTIGIAVDPRRKNRNEEMMAANVDRLKTYLSRLVVLPKKSGTKAAKKGNGGIPDDTLSKNLEGKKIAKSVKEAMPILNLRKALVA